MVTPSIKFWVIIPLFILSIFLVLVLAASYLRSGQFPSAWLIVSIILFAAFIGPALFVTRHIAQRIEQIIKAAEQVARGNLSIRVDNESDDEIGRLARAFNDMVENLGHLQQSRDLLSRTMSPAVRQSLMHKGLDFRGITQVVSVLFIDIRDFTRITEGHHSTEHLVIFLNDYYTTIANQVHIGGGIIGKYGGDSILAYFGAPDPEPAPKSSTAAFLTALALQDAIDQLSERWRILGLPPIHVGIGLSIGPVVAGPIGSEQQFEYTVIGDSVNLAARLQALTRNVDGYNIMLSRETYEALEQRVKNQIPVINVTAYEQTSAQERARRPVQFVDLGEVLVKGRRGPIHVYGIPDYHGELTNISDPTNGRPSNYASEPRAKNDESSEPAGGRASL
ncbi:MAG TPA: adenylate/guanylate cyclase domain-containing protein [Anaerolineae bacterium]|nr:adenylate/guanylate cyclase domain-containing protein [Anaerolineae bacterium]